MTVLLPKLVLTALSCCILAVTIAVAQENLGGNLSQDENGGSTGQRESRSEAQAAQVGAGTTSGTTTGSSGPKTSDGSAKGQIELPPPPNSRLCEGYRSMPIVHQSCLSVTLGN